MNFNELILKRRSIRKYLDKPVSNEIVLDILDDSIYAPSTGNEQPWKFIIVHNKVLMKKISDHSKSTLLKRINNNPDDYAKKYQHILSKESYNIFYNAPCVVFVLGDAKLKNTKINCSFASCYFMMSATSRGLGTCCINFATVIESGEILNELKIPYGYDIITPIIIGYPDIIPGPPKREMDVLAIIE